MYAESEVGQEVMRALDDVKERCMLATKDEKVSRCSFDYSFQVVQDDFRRNAVAQNLSGELRKFGFKEATAEKGKRRDSTDCIWIHLDWSNFETEQPPEQSNGVPA